MKNTRTEFEVKMNCYLKQVFLQARWGNNKQGQKMKSIIVVGLQILATVLLAVLVGSVEISDAGVNAHARLGFSFTWIFELSTAESAELAFSTIIFGYLASVAAHAFKQQPLNGLEKTSIGVSLVSSFCYLNESLRFFFHYDFRLLVSMPLVVVALDWIAYFRSKSPVVVAGQSAAEPAGAPGE